MTTNTFFKSMTQIIPVCLLFLAMLVMAACGGETENKDVADNAKKGDTEEFDFYAEPEADGKKPFVGKWRGILDIGEELIFNFDWKRKSNGDYTMLIRNGNEELVVEDVNFGKDSLRIKMPIFDSEFVLQYNNRRMLGNWYNYAKGPNYKIPFYAVFGDTARFNLPTAMDAPLQVDGKWEVVFISDDRKSKTDAVGEFVQQGQKVLGTFLTPTGDYRYLQGNANDEELRMSCFDGAHAFLFTAKMDDEGTLLGEFFSGNHYHETWIGFRNDTVTVANSYSLTKITDESKAISFSFPNVEGKKVSLEDDRYQGKVVMLQIMGTWCPNCMDETRLYTDLYKKYKGDGLEIIALAYENNAVLEKAKPLLKRYQKHFDIDYEVVLAGEASKTLASEQFPMLNKVISFPTTIFLDRKGEVRKIHTGFSGPATSSYEEYLKSLHSFLEELLGEGQA